MIEPSDFLVVAVAASLRPKRTAARRMSRREARRAVRLAHEAWPRIRAALLADVYRVAA